MSDFILKPNKKAVKFIPDLDKFNGGKILVYSPVDRQTYIINSEIYDIMIYLNRNNITMQKLIEEFSLDAENISVMNDLIDKQILIML